jgi:hypothetical protein
MISEGEIKKGYVFTSEMAKFSTSAVEFLIIPNRVQVSLLPRQDAATGKPVITAEAALSEIKPRIETVLDKLPHTPYKALGLNFAYIGQPEGEESALSLLRRVFYHEGTRFADSIAEYDFSIGSFLLHKWNGVSVKVEIKPTRYAFRKKEEPTQGILCDFNFQFEAGDDAVASFKSALGNWREAEQHARSLVESLMGS